MNIDALAPALLDYITPHCHLPPCRKRLTSNGNSRAGSCFCKHGRMFSRTGVF